MTVAFDTDVNLTVEIAFGDAPLAATKEVATVDRGTSTGGNFTLTVDAVTTAAILYNAAASAVKSALELLATVTTVTVTGTGTVGDPWICTFDDPIQNLAVSGTGTGLTGGDSTLTVTGTTPGAPTWTDVSAYARSFTVKRGRSHELDTVGASTLNMVLSNADGRFDPTYTGGAYYADVLPMVPIRVRAAYSSVTYDLFRGFVEAWPQAWPNNFDATVKVRAVDAFKLLGRVYTNGAEVSEGSGARIGNLIDDASWPTDARDIATGDLSVAAFTPNCESILSLCRKVDKTEGGLFFVAGDGDVTFQDQTHRAAESVAATFGDSGAELRYVDLKLGYDDHQIWNRVEVRTEGGTVQAAEDTTSITAYGKRTLKMNDTLHTSDATALTFASTMLARYKDPHVRVDSIAFKPRSNASGLWPQALGAELSDKYTVKRRPPAGNTISQDVYVEGITHTVDANKNWSTSFNLSQYS